MSELRKELTFGQLFALAFGTIIGVGWILTMGAWLGLAGGLGAPLQGFLTMLAMVPFFYAGFNVVPQALGEKAAGVSARAIFGAVVGSIIAAGAFYIAVTVSTAMIVPRTTLLDSPLPVAAAFRAAFKAQWLADCVLVAGLLGLLTTWNAVFFAAARVLYAFGTVGVIHPWFGRVRARHGTPANAIVFVGAVGLFGTFAGRGAVLPIPNALSAAMTAVFAIVCFAVWRLRRTQADLPRPYRAPGGAGLGLIAGLLCLGLALLALAQAGTGRSGIQAEWVVITMWSLLGWLFWIAARRTRAAIDETRRRDVLLNPD